MATCISSSCVARGSSEAEDTAQFDLADMFEIPFLETALPKDLPRLAGRISIKTHTLEHKAIALTRPTAISGGPRASVAAGPGAIAPELGMPPGPSAVAEVVAALATIFLDAEGQAETAVACQMYDTAVKKGEDPQPVCREMLTSLGGDASILVRALKLVHQGVILYGLATLRETVPLLTKDVRTVDGWLIYIEYMDVFRVRHVRREQSIEMPGFGNVNDHYEFRQEISVNTTLHLLRTPLTISTHDAPASDPAPPLSFEVSATLDTDLRRVCATWLRIKDVLYSPGMDPKKKDELMAVLGVGRRIVDGGSSGRLSSTSSRASTAGSQDGSGLRHRKITTADKEVEKIARELGTYSLSNFEYLFPANYFHSDHWQQEVGKLAVVELGQCTDAASLWAATQAGSSGLSFDSADVEPVLDTLWPADQGGHTDLFSRVIPFMASLVMKAPAVLDEDIPLLRVGKAGTVSLEQDQTACLLAMMALSVGLPDVVMQRAGGEGMDGTFRYPLMAPVMWPKRGCDFAPNVAQLRMVVALFSRIEREGVGREEVNVADGDSVSSAVIMPPLTLSEGSSRRVVGGIAVGGAEELEQVPLPPSTSTSTSPSTSLPPLVFKRLVATEPEREFVWADSTVPLATLRLAPMPASLHDAVGHGCVAAHEEVAFASQPELTVAKLLVETLRDDEALVLAGARAFSNWSGNLKSLEFAGAAEDLAFSDASWVAIDGPRYSSSVPHAQWNDPGTARDLLKTVVGFRGTVDSIPHTAGLGNSTPRGTIATGCWGHGAFNGCPSVKVIIQLMAASAAGAEALLFHVLNDTLLFERLGGLAAALEGRTIGHLWGAVTAAAANIASEDTPDALFLAVIEEHIGKTA